MTTSPSFSDSNSINSFDACALATLLEDNEGSNQENNTSQENSRYSVDTTPPLKLQVKKNERKMFERKILLERVMKINFLINSGFAIIIIDLATFQNLKKVKSKLRLKTTKIKTVPYGKSKKLFKN